MRPVGRKDRSIEVRVISVGVVYGCLSSALQLTAPENIITYHNALCLSPQNFA